MQESHAYTAAIAAACDGGKGALALLLCVERGRGGGREGSVCDRARSHPPPPLPAPTPR